jgi:hypothetical protein
MSPAKRLFSPTRARDPTTGWLEQARWVRLIIEGNARLLPVAGYLDAGQQALAFCARVQPELVGGTRKDE